MPKNNKRGSDAMKLAFRVRQSGGILVAVEMAGRFIELPAATDEDPLSQLGLAAIELLSGAASSRVDFIRQPDGYRLKLNRTEDAQILEARLAWCDDLKVPGGPFEQEDIAHDVITARDFGLNVLEVFESVAKRCNAEAYRARTFGLSFPTAIHQRLFALLGVQPGEVFCTEGHGETKILWQGRDPALRRETQRQPFNPEESLKQWQMAHRNIVLDSEHPLERFLLRAIQERQTIESTYHGVTETTRRRVQPRVLFCVEGYTPAYLEGFCETRQALRTFCLDRMVVDGYPAPAFLPRPGPPQVEPHAL